MPFLKVRKDAAGPRRFSMWSLALWVLLLLLAYGGLQYLQHGDFPYLAATFVAIVICVGAIMRHEWARSATRVVVLLIALYALVSGIAMLMHWGDFEQMRQAALANPQFADDLSMMLERTKRVYQIALGLKAISIPCLLWLAWVLGQPAVRAQFHRRQSRFSKG
jgi:energy-coupling factor transporter transmembrane protein EcfT